MNSDDKFWLGLWIVCALFVSSMVIGGLVYHYNIQKNYTEKGYEQAIEYYNGYSTMIWKKKSEKNLEKHLTN